MNDTLLLDTGINILVERLGLVEAERFVYLMNREHFDYTQWRQNIFEGMSGMEISSKAMKHRQTNNNNGNK